MKKKIFALLALLMTAATGAWSQTSAVDGKAGRATNKVVNNALLGNRISPKKAPRKTPAENVIFFDDFESGTLDNWTLYKKNQGNGWIMATPAAYGGMFPAYSGTYCASSWSWNNASYNVDDWLITPKLNLGGTVSFFAATNGSYPDSYEVLLSTTGNQPEDFTIVLREMARAEGDKEWIENSFDLADYNGQEGYIAIHHVNYDMNYLLIDDFTVEAAPELYDLTGETGDCFWGYTESTKTLTIYGNGAMEDYADVSEQPWADFALDIETVIIKKGVTRIGDRAFLDLKNMSFVSIPNGVESIGNYAFYDCWSLPFVSIPASVTDMGLDAFWLCLRLRNVYMYADVNNLSWLDTDCDDFTFGTLAVCHVAGSIDPWKEKYEKKVNVNFKGDLEEIPEEYALEDPFKISIVDNDFGKVTTFVDGAEGKMAEAGAAVMVKVQPQEGYIAELVYGHGYIRWEEAAARAAAPTMDLINELEVSKLKDNVWAFAMPGADVKLSVAYRKLMTHADISFGDIDDMEYTGKTLTPEVTVYDGEDELVEGVDYTVEYTQTVAAGDAVITVRGIGDYAGETTTSFVITAKSGSGLTVEVADAEAGEVPAILVKDENRTLAEGYDYDITFQDAEGKAVTKEEMVPGGSYKAVIDLKANYYGQLTKTFSVSEPEEEPDPSTGIASASRTNGKSAVYGLSGRRVNSNAKGLVISGGKKLLKK